MPAIALVLSLSFLLLILPSTHALFALNKTTPNFAFSLPENLANTTSRECIAAYSRLIECNVSLLRLVGGQRPRFAPRRDDFINICDTRCRDALERYIEQVKKGCGRPGDKIKLLSAPEKIPMSGGGGHSGLELGEKGQGKGGGEQGKGDGGHGQGSAEHGTGSGNGKNDTQTGHGHGNDAGDGNHNVTQFAKLWTPGRMLLYGYTQLCADSEKSFCLLRNASSSRPCGEANPLETYDPNPSCDDTCAIAFYSNIDDFSPAARFHFVNSSLVKRGRERMARWSQGLARTQNCTRHGNGKKKGADESGDNAMTTTSSDVAAATGDVVVSSQAKGNDTKGNDAMGRLQEVGLAYWRYVGMLVAVGAGFAVL